MSNNRRSQLIDFNKCSCKGTHLDKLIQPMILTLLMKQDLHGYKIIKELEDRNVFLGQKPDRTGIYRTLQMMEKRKLVISIWDVSGEGTAKKVYKLTELGKKCLMHWIATLEQYKRNIEIILNEAREVCNVDE